MSRDETPPELNLDNLGLENDDDDALETLASLDNEVRAPIITPPEERFPPLKPPPQPDRQTRSTDDAPAPSATNKPQSRRKLAYNLLTGLALLAIIPAVVWLALVWQNPQSAYNPFPPPTPFVQITATPGNNAVSSAPGMPTPNQQGQIIIVATETPSSSTTDNNTAPSAYEIVPAAQEIQFAANQNTLGCEWTSIAGTIQDAAGNGLSGYRVRVIGDEFRETVFSGNAPLIGSGGYEVQIASEPVTTTLQVQVVDPAGTALSEAVTVTTRATCDSNVARLDFVQRES